MLCMPLRFPSFRSGRDIGADRAAGPIDRTFNVKAGGVAYRHIPGAVRARGEALTDRAIPAERAAEPVLPGRILPTRLFGEFSDGGNPYMSLYAGKTESRPLGRLSDNE